MSENCPIIAGFLASLRGTCQRHAEFGDLLDQLDALERRREQEPPERRTHLHRKERVALCLTYAFNAVRELILGLGIVLPSLARETEELTQEISFEKLELELTGRNRIGAGPLRRAKLARTQRILETCAAMSAAVREYLEMPSGPAERAAAGACAEQLAQVLELAEAPMSKRIQYCEWLFDDVAAG